MLIFSVSFQFLRMTPKSSGVAGCARGTHRGPGMPDRVMTFQQERTTGSKHVHACMHAPTNQSTARSLLRFDLLIEDN